MKTRRFLLTVTVGVLLLSVGLFVGNHDGIAPAAPATPLDQILARLHQIHAAVSDLQTQVNSLPTTQADLRGVTQNWDKALPADDPGGPCPSNSSRFTCLFGGAAVRDNETGLVWEQSPDTTHRTWEAALDFCANRTVAQRNFFAGRKGWRLPSVAELASLIDLKASTGNILVDVLLPVGHPFSVLPAVYWSASSSAAFPSYAWFVFFSDGRANIGNKIGFSPAWCVRGGMQESVY